jgi:hypothetical protein
LETAVLNSDIQLGEIAAIGPDGRIIGQITGFGEIEAQIEELAKYRGAVFAVGEKKGMADASRVVGMCVKARTGTEKQRKAMTSGIDRLKGVLVDREKQLVASIREIETPIAGQITTEKARVVAEEQVKAELERIRNLEIQQLINRLRGRAAAMHGKSPDEIRAEIVALQDEAITMGYYGDLVADAALAKEDGLRQLEVALQNAIAAEADRLELQRLREVVSVAVLVPPPQRSEEQGTRNEGTRDTACQPILNASPSMLDDRAARLPEIDYCADPEPQYVDETAVSSTHLANMPVSSTHIRRDLDDKFDSDAGRMFSLPVQTYVRNGDSHVQTEEITPITDHAQRAENGHATGDLQQDLLAIVRRIQGLCHNADMPMSERLTDICGLCEEALR